MSVVKNKRNLSDLEFYHTAITLRKEITLLLLRDFGVKDKIRNTKILAHIHNISPEDEAALSELLEKYDMGDSIVEEYPEWLIDKMRSSIMNILRDLIMNITAANSIYVTYESEYYERRKYQTAAIGNCEQLLQEMQYVISVIPVDTQKYMPYVEMIEREISLLRGWRKSDNKALSRVKNKEKKQESVTDILNKILALLERAFPNKEQKHK